MGLTIAIVSICIALGAFAAVAARGDFRMPDFAGILGRADLKRFSPRKTLFIIGPSEDHAACRMQRRLLKPAIAALIRDDVAVIEIYGDETPRTNGEPMDWLDASLLRHAMTAEEGFYVIYVDDDGKTRFRSQAPMLTADILERAGLDAPAARGSRAVRKSDILKKLRAA